MQTRNGITFRGLALAASLSVLLTAGCATGKRSNDKISQEPLKDTVPSGLAKPDPQRAVRLNIELASEYYAAGQFQTALNVVDRALQIDPENVQALALAGLVHAALRDPDRGRAMFDRALKIAPDSADLHHNFGVFLCRHSNPEEGLPHFKKAISTPGYPGLVNSLTASASCLVKAGRDVEAERDYGRALGMDQFNAGALFGMANLTYQQGRIAESKAYYGRLNRVAQADSQILWLGVRIARSAGDKQDENMLSDDLLQRYPDSDQAKKLINKEFD
jgi:type IV pilus assembly protein PilF